MSGNQDEAKVVRLDPKTTWVPAAALIGAVGLAFLVGTAWASVGREDHQAIIILQHENKSQQAQIDAIRAYMEKNDERWLIVRDDLHSLKLAAGLVSSPQPRHPLWPQQGQQHPPAAQPPSTGQSRPASP